jgi:protein phosphatase
MGTTLSVILVRPQVAFVAHVGDSRVYMLREGKYRVVTADHTFVAAMVKQGKMTRQEARRSRFSNMLTRAVGSRDYVEVDTKVIRHQTGDTFFLCSDGLHRYLKKGELTKFLDAKNINRSIDRLINMALVRGGRDNITAIALRVDP